MRYASTALLLVAFSATTAPGPAIPYFTNVRDVQVSQPDRQNYLVVDEEIWDHARPDLADLRLYDGEVQVQYVLSEQQGGTSTEEQEARILNLGSIGGHTEFDIDVGKINEYDRVHLRLEAKDFVVTASLAGANTLGSGSATNLGSFTLYDLTREALGSNSTLKLPPSSFRYLHVRLSAGIRPPQVKGVMVSNLREQRANWMNVGACAVPEQKDRTTVMVCDVPEKVPLNRILFQVGSNQVNFRRTITIVDSKGLQVGAGDICRVRLNRAGMLVTSEDLAVSVIGALTRRITLTVDNGDNPPLALTGVQPQSVERRAYFDPQGKAALKLYYGDEKLSAPSYDYAKFFHLDESAATAQLGPGVHNDAYAGRPDTRPWSERHPAVLWVAMLLAVAVLAAMAIRGLGGGRPVVHPHDTSRAAGTRFRGYQREARGHFWAMYSGNRPG
jgi:hypothetical protein